MAALSEGGKISGVVGFLAGAGGGLLLLDIGELMSDSIGMIEAIAASKALAIGFSGSSTFSGTASTSGSRSFGGARFSRKSSIQAANNP